MKLKSAKSKVLLGTLFAAIVVASIAADQPTAGKDDVAKSELLTNRNTSEPPSKPKEAGLPAKAVSMWCTTTNNAHIIRISASNSAATNASCSSICYYQSGGATGSLYCSGTVPAHANNVTFCSRYSSNSTFVVTDPGYNNCP
jgi:hypothetical protein